MNSCESGMHCSNILSTVVIKIFRYSKNYRRHFLFECTATYCTKCNEIRILHSSIQKHVSYEKCFKYYKYFVYKLTQNFPEHYGLRGEGFLKHTLANLCYTKCNKMKILHLVVV